MKYTNRKEYAASGDECQRSPTCQLIREHGGECDDRPERERWRALFAGLARSSRYERPAIRLALIQAGNALGMLDALLLLEVPGEDERDRGESVSADARRAIAAVIAWLDRQRP
jgi:hypothetical protein